MASKKIERSEAKKSAPGLGPIDKALLQGAAQRKSLEEISALVGGVLSPAECGYRINQILESRDWLSVLDQKRLILEDAAMMLDKLRKQMDQTEWVTKDDANTFRQALKDMLEMIDNVTAKDEAQMMRITEAHARVMAQAIRLGYERTLFELQKRFDIDEQTAYEALERSVPVMFEFLTDGQ
jgi:hypothetical protein